MLVEALVLDGRAGEGRKAECTIEGHPRHLALVEAEDELVAVGLKVLRLHGALVGAISQRFRFVVTRPRVGSGSSLVRATVMRRG